MVGVTPVDFSMVKRAVEVWIWQKLPKYARRLPPLDLMCSAGSPSGRLGGEEKESFCFVVAESGGGHGGYAPLVRGRDAERLRAGTSVVLSRRETTVSSLVTASYNKRCLLQYFIVCGLICFLSAGQG